MEDKETPLYHCTDRKGAKAISKSKVIKGSDSKNGDAVFGNGAYLTSMNPNIHSKKEMRRNNYDGSPSFYNSPGLADKTDYVVEVRGLDKARRIQTPDNRDVWLHTGDVDLTKHNYKIYKKI